LNEIDDILAALLEDDPPEEDTGEPLSDLLWHKPVPFDPLPGHIEIGKTRYGRPSQSRWKNVVIGDFQFCISYLTPVAVYDEKFGGLLSESVRITGRNWGPRTIDHIKRWLDHLGIGRPDNWKELSNKFQRIPQKELIDLFHEKANQVKWSERELNQLHNIPRRDRLPFLKGDTEDRINVSPYDPVEGE
jgi:hypothetical protein